MAFRHPSLMLWLLPRMGIDVSFPMLGRSFVLRWLVYGLNFLLTGGALAVIGWHLFDERNRLGWHVFWATVASALYGLLAAAANPAATSND